MTSLHFVPWVRKGLASRIDGFDADGRATFPVTVKLGVDQSRVRETSVDISMFGPGDVLSMNTSSIGRVEPKPHTSDFEPNYFPFVEFSIPELPWLMTPEAANPSASPFSHLRPWIALLVVPAGDDVTITAKPSVPNQVLQVGSSTLAGFTLPDLSDSSWWAHVQVVGNQISNSAQLHTVIADDPARVRSRLLSPIRTAV